jgi:hypothetical protein
VSLKPPEKNDLEQVKDVYRDFSSIIELRAEQNYLENQLKRDGWDKELVDEYILYQRDDISSLPPENISPRYENLEDYSKEIVRKFHRMKSSFEELDKPSFEREEIHEETEFSEPSAKEKLDTGPEGPTNSYFPERSPRGMYHELKDNIKPLGEMLQQLDEEIDREYTKVFQELK